MRKLAAEGCREITLLGQTVNSYQHTADGRTTRLADLLELLHDVPGIDRIKFVTNYPKDMTTDLLQAVRDLPRCSHYLHVPVQSGSNAVLKRMKRGYTVEDYREMLGRIRDTIPDAAVTSDFIVGFCGETEEDFAASVELCAKGDSRTASFSSTARARGPKATNCTPTMCQKRPSAAAITNCWNCKQPSVKKTTRSFWDVKCASWSRG